MRTRMIVMGLACCLGLYACASQEDVTTLGSRMAQMDAQNNANTSDLQEQEKTILRLRQTQQDREAMEEKIRSQAAQLRVLIEELRVDVARLSGKVEESDYHLQQRIQTLEKYEKQRMSSGDALAQRVDANQERLAQVVNYLNLEPTQPAATEPSPGEPAGEASAVSSDSELYAMAKKAFDNKGFEAALKGFQKLIGAYPKSEHADNAQFWIGEIYYREKWYEKAILEYQKVIENYPKGNKVKAALLKQGFAFSNLGDKANARLILKELVKKYPNANEAVIAKKKLLEVK
ncbi:MAG: tol-pal system protein YbgF [Desulfobacterales bacterium]|nr:tol-pal system protein YbgF [Desulfobacterales bacterium]